MTPQADSFDPFGRALGNAGDAGVAPTATIRAAGQQWSLTTCLGRRRTGVADSGSLAVERGLNRVGDAAVGEDDAADATVDGAERGFDLDHHAACRCCQ